jgi:hypothetical protein
MSDKEKIRLAINKLQGAVTTNYELVGTWRSFCWGLLEDLQKTEEPPTDEPVWTNETWEKRKRMIKAYDDLKYLVMQEPQLTSRFLILADDYVTAKVWYMLALKEQS